MIVVSDTSPLIALAAVGRLDLLRKLYGEVLIPEAVHREATASPGAPGAAAIGAAEWLRVEAVRDRTLVAALSLDLDQGEAEAIALAIERGADLLLVDERRGRTTATRLGQRVVGVLGVLIEAKRSRDLQAVRPVLDVLASEVGFRMTEALYARVLKAADE